MRGVVVADILVAGGEGEDGTLKYGKCQLQVSGALMNSSF